MTVTNERFSPRQRSYVAAAAIALVSLAGGYGLSMLGGGEGDAATSSSDAACEEVLYWYDPMVPGQRFDEPGKSPFMDMQLVPKCAGGDAAGGADGVSIDPAIAQNFGVRTMAAEMGMLESDTSVTGTLAYNGGDVATVQPRAGGYVQRGYGLAPQDVVASGAPIVDLLIPEWGGAQREFLAVAATGDAALT
ncbi:MAG: efflux RND transporter periplasmic adaptor subunit, partial [Pacificimonas sp.]